MGGQRHDPAVLPPKKDPIPIVQKAGWAPGPVWTGAENIAPIGIRSPDRPARRNSLYRLSYPGPLNVLQLLMIARLATRILRWLLGFRKICGSPDIMDSTAIVSMKMDFIERYRSTIKLGLRINQTYEP